jgi:SlyX protein
MKVSRFKSTGEFIEPSLVAADSRGPPMSDSTALADRLAEIEAKLSFSEDALDEINRTVYRQQQQIERLQHELRALQAIVEGGEADTAAGPRDDVPPHY